MTAIQIIEQLDLLPHPEGGYYRETYRSNQLLNLENYHGQRHVSTGIYYLLVEDKFSAFHHIKQDEMWHFYKGGPLELHIISKQGHYQKVLIGNQLEHGEVPQYVVRGGDYFAARVCPEQPYSLAGCTVAPGFDFKDFEMPDRAALMVQFPEHKDIIAQLTHKA